MLNVSSTLHAPQGVLHVSPSGTTKSPLPSMSNVSAKNYAVKTKMFVDSASSDARTRRNKACVRNRKP